MSAGLARGVWSFQRCGARTSSACALCAPLVRQSARLFWDCETARAARAAVRAPVLGLWNCTCSACKICVTNCQLSATKERNVRFSITPLHPYNSCLNDLLESWQRSSPTLSYPLPPGDQCWDTSTDSEQTPSPGCLLSSSSSLSSPPSGSPASNELVTGDIMFTQHT